MDHLIEKLDSYGKGAWIAAMVLGFILFWPIGLALLFFMIWSGRMGCKSSRWRDRWHSKSARMGTSGNIAFDEYKQATIRRLEDEQREFRSFLDDLRKAKDKEEFDQFMKELKSGKRKTRKADEDKDAGGMEPVPAT